MFSPIHSQKANQSAVISGARESRKRSTRGATPGAALNASNLDVKIIKKGGSRGNQSSSSVQRRGSERRYNKRDEELKK